MNPFLIDHLNPLLNGKKILLGITGSIAAFKACDIVRHLVACGAQVRVVLTRGAENFVTKTTLETLSHAPVLTGFWTPSESGQTLGTHHIDTARWADAILVAPCTAAFIGKMAHGLADDLLSTEILAFRGPLLIAPAMNPAMYAHPAVQQNVRLLTERGAILLGPVEGLTSCGEEGLGRMLDPVLIVEKVAFSLIQCSFIPSGQIQLSHTPASTPGHQPDRKINNKRMILTLGPTRSPIDAVRYLTNRSSGLMGASLCWAAVAAGYEVSAICGPTTAQLPSGIEIIPVQTAQEMANAALSLWSDTLRPADVFISAAAVLDWDIQDPAAHKLKKEDGPPSLKLIKNPDILSMISARKKPHQFVLGFAAETDSPVPNALKKLKAKGCDAIFVNDVSDRELGFESERNGGWWITSSGEALPLGPSTKPELARTLISMMRR